MIKAKNALFIKLGKKDEWVEYCIEKNPTIRLGFNNPHHKECIKKDWSLLTKYWSTLKKSKGKVTETVNQIKYFYQSPSADTLWITFYKGKLYWCFAQPSVKLLRDGSKIRKVVGKWSSKDINGNPLYVDNLSGKLTKVQGFRGTICRVKEFDYLLRKLNNQKLPIIKEAESSLSNLKNHLKPLIQSLNWKDFELLVDLIFTSSGWQRTSVVGKSVKDIDITLLLPVNNKKAFVQVKSEANFKTFNDYKDRFKKQSQFDELYFVYHKTKDKKLSNIREENNISVITLDKITELVINAGLINWLLKKVS